jgi:tripartite-type tricarboxylate transporter receptor subunit TctC
VNTKQYDGGVTPVKKHSRQVIAAILLALSHAATCSAGSYPDGPVRIIIPFAAGGFTDVGARVVAQQLTIMLGQSFITENMPGAGSTIGTEYVAKSKPDGYTLVMLSTNNVTSNLLYKNLAYDPIKSFTPIAEFADTPYVFVVNSTLAAHTVKEFIALAKAKPHTINFASSGNGSTQHLMGALFASRTGAPITHVPYRGSAQAMQDLAAGFVQSSFAAVSNALPQIRSGKIRALAVTSIKRAAQLPDVPTLEEAGVPNYHSSVWLALAGPAGMPKDVVARLNAAVTKIMAMPDSIKTLAAVGVDARSSTPDQLEKVMVDDAALWGKVIKDVNIKVD